MKTSIHRAHRLRPAGMTLIEVSLVIGLLISLIGVLFIGMRSYREGSNKAKCKMQLASAQKAMRAQANFRNLAIGSPYDSSMAFGPGQALDSAPTCPAGGTYAWVATIPLVGTPYGTCDYVDTDGVVTHELSATEISNW